jgi:hypothetical protein
MGDICVRQHEAGLGTGVVVWEEVEQSRILGGEVVVNAKLTRL